MGFARMTDPFDFEAWMEVISEQTWHWVYLSKLNDVGLDDVGNISGAETELDYYTDPAPYEFFPELMWSNPHYVGWKDKDGVVRVERAGEKPADIERLAKQVEQINRVCEKLLGDTTANYESQTEQPRDYTLTEFFGGNEDRWMGRL